MGLDTYAARTPVDFFDPDLELEKVDENFGCTEADLAAFARAEEERGGYCLFSGNYFRGKTYVDLVRHVTGIHLATTWIPPETVRRMAEAFEQQDPEATMREIEESGESSRDYTARDVLDLQVFFRVCAERGLGLVGSW